jgi:hypothetical protein
MEFGKEGILFVPDGDVNIQIALFVKNQKRPRIILGTWPVLGGSDLCFVWLPPGLRKRLIVCVLLVSDLITI